MTPSPDPVAPGGGAMAPVRTVTSTAARTVARPFVGALRAWRRSLQLRVVTATVLLSAVVIALVGVLLQSQIAEGVVATKQRSAEIEAFRGFQEAQLQLNASTDGGGTASTGLGARVNVILQQLYARSGDSEFEIAARGTARSGTGTSFLSARSTPDLDSGSVPESLAAEVVRTGSAHRTYGTIGYTDGSEEPDRLGLIIGNVVSAGDAGDIELYYFFPLDEEQQTLALVQRTLIIACVLLIGLIGLIAWFVVRQTVTPVRLAARIAERLAAGRLQERMHVQGEDDLARLATSFNKMATNLQQQIKQLEDLSRMQQRFVSDVSHELRTPLTTVRMAADLLHEARPDFDASTARAAELLQKELDRFENLLGELLEISRFDAGAAELEIEVVDCRDLARQVVEASTTLATRLGTELRLHLPPDPCVAEVDPRRIDRILRNLVENAIEHGEGRPIDVTVGADPATVAFTVRDHGIGLRPGEAASVFNRFWRGDPSRTRTIGGTGLGLAIAQEDTRLHHGWLQAWGKPGTGSQFRLTLPRVAGGPVESSPLPIVPRELANLGVADYPANHPADHPAEHPGDRAGRPSTDARTGVVDDDQVPAGPGSIVRSSRG